MNASTVLFLLLVLACPLLMVFLHGGHGGGHADHDASPSSVEDLRRKRDELDREIAAREATCAAADDEPGSDAANGHRALART